MEDIARSLSNLISECDELGSMPFGLKRNQDMGLLTQPAAKKKRSDLPRINPDPDTEVVALSPSTLAAATVKYICEICGKEFIRDQNLQLHRRVHNIPWKLKPINSSSREEVLLKKEKTKVYVCPEASCVHHHPSRAMRDLTGIRKHFCRKHGEKKWKCEKCFKSYGVEYDWKIHSKTCAITDYRCDCGIVFPRRESFVSHRAFCGISMAEGNHSRSMKQTPQTILSSQSQFQRFEHQPLNPFEQEQQDSIDWTISSAAESGSAGGPGFPSPTNLSVDLDGDRNPKPNFYDICTSSSFQVDLIEPLRDNDGTPRFWATSAGFWRMFAN